ncbi:MAG: hypothetical protein HQ589_07180 [Syntrophaceae bacterium]|nr:hypothetical protein [Syntrophaceae bacterium]
MAQINCSVKLFTPLLSIKKNSKYIRLDRNHITIDRTKIENDARFGGKRGLKMTTDLPHGQVGLKGKDFW